MAERHETVLAGCNPTPLASYLKGLGIVRVLSACDPTLQGAWMGQDLHLVSEKPTESLHRYLIDEYAPTPIVAPWNGGSGFYEKDNSSALLAIANSKTSRFAAYRTCLTVVERSLEGLPRDASPKKQAKTQLLTRLRNLLPDKALDWFDAAILLAGQKEKFPPLLGTGGNDGRLDFTNNFMQRLLDLIDPGSGAAEPKSATWLNLALFGKPAPGLVKQAIGQFAPGQVGGPNSVTGYDAKGTINPWEFVLMIEGALPFAAAAVRRNEHGGEGVLSYPFTVRASTAGGGNLGAGDAASSRGELWMPLWSKPASFAEIRALLAEGRVAFGTRPARDALDFVRAVHRLGGYRGVDRFQRYSLLMRSGKAFLATPLERVQITTNPKTEWIDDLERNDWLSKFRKFAQDKNSAIRFAGLRHRLENLMFALAQREPSPSQVQALVILLGEIQVALAHSTKACEKISPVPQLSDTWLRYANDGSAAFRIARALAGLRGLGTLALPLRSQLFPIHHSNSNEWREKACKHPRLKDDPACRVRLHIPSQRNLTATLIALLQQRLSLTSRLDFRDKPLNSSTGVDLPARALAGLRGLGTLALPLRSQLFPIHHSNSNEWREKACKHPRLKDDPACRVRLHIPSQRNLTATLIALLQQRLSLTSRLDFRDKPLNSSTGVDLPDLYAFLMDGGMDSSIAALLPGLSLCTIPESSERTAGEKEIHAAFALCKLALTPDSTLRSLGVLVGDEQHLPIAPQLVSKLATGDMQQAKHAIKIAWQRLRGSGLQPLMPFNQLPELAGVNPRRLAASLLIPLSYGDTGILAKIILKGENST